MRIVHVVAVGVIGLFIAISVLAVPSAIAQDEMGSGTLEIHWRYCEDVPTGGDWYGECHDSAGSAEPGRDVAMVNSDINERFPSTLDSAGNATFALPPGTYFIEGAPGDFVEEAYSFCSTADSPGTDIGHPVTIAAGDSVVCDYYYVPYDASAPTVSPEESEATESPSSEEPSALSTEPVATETTASQEPTSTAIYVGDCTPGEFKDPVAYLPDPVLPSGEKIGTSDDPTVATSASTIPVSLESLTGDAHVLTLFDPKQPDRLLACGEIGGVAGTDGSLTIALIPSDGSGVMGIAYLVPTAESVGVSLFVVEPDVPATPVG